MGFALDEKTSALVLRQVEFYFSDSNLPGDKFLRQCVEEAADGLVSLPLVCSFGRMRSHLSLKESGPDKVPAETTAAVADVLRKSTVLKLSDDGQKVGRVVPLLKLEEVQAAVDARSIAVGPLRWTVTMEEVETFISQHVQVNSVRLPRYLGGRAFCGSALVETCSEDEVKKALELKLSYDGVDLEIKPKKDLDAELERIQKQAKEVPNGKSISKKVGEVEPTFLKGLIVAFSLQKMSPMEVGVSEMKETTAVDCKEGETSKEVSTTGASEEEAAKEAIQISREDIRDAFKGFGYIKYIDFNRGTTTGYLRYEKPEEVQKARTAAVLADSGGIVVKDYIATLEAVEGAAEEEYWSNIKEYQEKVRADSGRGSRGRGGGSRGRGGGRSYDKPRRDNRFDRSGGRGGQQQNEGKTESDANLGKHQRFEDADSEGEAERPSKQNKSAGEAADLTSKQSDAGDTPM